MSHLSRIWEDWTWTLFRSEKNWDIHQFEICHMIAGPTFTDQSDQKEDVRFWPPDNDVRIYRAGQADLKEQVKALLE